MRIAGFVNHQTVERTLHFFAREVSLFECELALLEGSGFQIVGVVDCFAAVSPKDQQQ